jgi:predicted deacylase
MNKSEDFILTAGNSISGGQNVINGYRFTRGIGPSVYIQGGTHGGEVTFLIFHLLNSFLKENTAWEGIVTLVPIANPYSWQQRIHYTTIGKFNFYDGKDWNRSFPGNKDGSTAERWAHTLFQEAGKHDLVIDLHTSRQSLPFLIISREDLIQEMLQVGTIPIYVAPKMNGNFPLPDAIDNIGKKGLTIECGSHDSMDLQNINKCFEALLNLLRINGVLKDQVSLPESTHAFYFKKYDTYFAPDSGCVDYVHALGQEITRGELLYRIYPTGRFGEVLNITAKEDCIIMKYQPTHIAWAGDEVVTVVNLSDKIKIAE